jgi:hypothetical protein
MPAGSGWPGGPGANVSERHKMGVVLELPQRALS